MQKQLLWKKSLVMMLLASMLAAVWGFFPGAASAASGEADVIETDMVSKALFADGTYPLGEGHTGVQVVKLEVTPQSNGIDALIVYLDSDDDTANFAFNKMTTTLRFKPQGFFDVKNGTPWSYENELYYSAGTKYYVKMIIDLNQQKYSVWVTPENEEAVLIADQYDFRVNTSADDIGQLMLQSASDDLIVVSRHALMSKEALDAAVAAVHSASNAAEMKDAIISPNLALSLDLYGSMDENGKLAVAQAMLDNRPAEGFADDLAIQSALNRLIIETDLQPPTDPAELTAEPNRSLQVALHWSPAQDPGGSGIKSYHIYRDGQRIADTASTSFVDTDGLAAGAVHTYTVTAVDIADHESSGLQTVTITVPLDSKPFPFNQEKINSAMDVPLLVYTRTPDDVFEQRPSSVESAGAFSYLVMVAQHDPEFMNSRGKTVREAVIDHTRSMMSGGKEPGFGGGSGAIGYLPAAHALLMIKHNSVLWNEFTAEEQGEMSLLMQAALVGAHWGFDDDNDFDTGLEQLGNFNKGWNAGYRNNRLGTGIAAVYYFGAAEADELLRQFDYDDFMAKILAAGFTNIYNVFGTTGKEALEAATKHPNGFTYQGHSTAEVYMWVKELIDFTFSNPVAPEGGSFPTMGYLVSGKYDLPNVGLIGMQSELDARDAEGVRSSLVYASRTWTSSLRNFILALQFSGQEMSALSDHRERYQKVDIGTIDILYKGEHGYNDYQKGNDTGVHYLTDDLEVQLLAEYWNQVINNPQASVDAVNQAGDSTGVTTALTAPELNLILAGYNALTEEARLLVSEGILAGQPAGGYPTKAAIQEKLHELVTVQGFAALNQASSVVEMQAALESQALGLYIPTYRQSTGSLQQAAARALLNERPAAGYLDRKTVAELADQYSAPGGNQLRNLQPIGSDGTPRIDLASFGLWPEEHGEAAVALWNDDKLGAFSLSLERNQHENDIPRWKQIIEQYGYDYTFFIATNDINDASQWESLIALEQDVQSLTMSGSLSFHTFTEEQMRQEYAGSIEAIRNLQGGNARTLGYPVGSGASTFIPIIESLASQYFVSARGNNAFPNYADSVNYLHTNSWGFTSNSQMAAASPDTGSSVEQMIRTLIDPEYKVHGNSYYRGWSSMHTQRPLDNIRPGGTVPTETVIRYTLDTLKQYEDKIWVGTYTDIAMYAQSRDTAELEIKEAATNRITLELTDRMDDTLYDYPLTVKVRVDNGWSNISAMQDGHAVPAQPLMQEGKQYVLVKAVPDRGEVTLYPAPTAAEVVLLTGPDQAAGGEELVLTLSLNSVTTSVYAKSAIIGYDPARFSFIGAESLIEGFTVLGSTYGNGQIKLIEAGLGQSVTGTQDLVQLRFQTLPSAITVTSSIYLKEILVGDSEGNEKPLEAGPAYHVTVNKPSTAALEASIADAKALAAGAPVSDKLFRHYKQAVVDKLKAAAARAEADAAQAGTQAEVVLILAELAAELQAFKDAVNQIAGIGDLGMMAAHYDATPAHPGWSQVYMYDLDNDGRNGLSDLSALARMILD